jgi:RNA polymerase sigma-B factor
MPAAVDESVETLVRTHLGLAERLALRYAGRGQPYDDLQQVAYLGLVTAARRFDPDRGVRFVTFAQATVVGELKKYFRDHAWSLHVARPVQELYLEVRTASEELTQLTGRSPTTQELARHVGTTEEHVVEAIEAGAALHVDSLDVPLRDAEEGPREVSFDEGGFRLVEERSWLVPALALLPAREREIIRLRFFEGLPQSAIAVAVGVSQMHVSRLLARALAALRVDAAG